MIEDIKRMNELIDEPMDPDEAIDLMFSESLDKIIDLTKQRDNGKAEIAAKDVTIQEWITRYQDLQASSLSKNEEAITRIQELEALLSKAKEALIEERALRIPSREHEPLQAMNEAEKQLAQEYPDIFEKQEAKHDHS